MEWLALRDLLRKNTLVESIMKLYDKRISDIRTDFLCAFRSRLSMTKDPLFQMEPLSASAKMPERVRAALQELIRNGSYTPGSRLPAEGEMAQRFGVSRTVIREAVSHLKADGLVESRQGSGVFVARNLPAAPFRLDVAAMHSVTEVLQVAELRRGMEAEIAALAAERASPAQVAQIERCLAAIDEDVAAGGDGVAADIEFHRSIARATNNPHFLALCDYLGHFLHATIRLTRAWEAQREETREQVTTEHRALFDAIASRNVNAAREAARRHMEMSSGRIQGMDPEFLRQHPIQQEQP